MDTTEKKTSTLILEVFNAILKRDDLKVNDSFFAAGGNSLKAVALLGRLQEQWNVDISIADIFTYPTPAELGAWIESQQNGKLLLAVRRARAKLLNERVVRSVYQYAQNVGVTLGELFVSLAFYAFSLVDKKN